MKRWMVMVLVFLLSCFAGAAEKSKEPVKGPVVEVGGQVNKPQTLDFRGNTTLLAVIFEAGGPTKFASMRRVKVVRKGKAHVFDLTKAKGKVELVEPGDVIEVPEANLFGR